MNEDKPTELTTEDIDNLVHKLLNSDIKQEYCFKCGKEFFPRTNGLCDECFFSQFPKDEVAKFCEGFLQ
jgi:uncharacterized OB-fold protein